MMLSPCGKGSAAAVVGKDICQWPEVTVTNRKGWASTGVQAVSWKTGAAKAVCSRGKDLRGNVK